MFLRLAEMSSGEYDFRFEIDQYISGTSFNYTKIKKNSIFKQGKYSLNSPRFLNYLRIYSAIDCKDEIEVPKDISNSTFISNSTIWRWTYKGQSRNASCGMEENCLFKFCKKSVDGKILVLDSQREKKMNFGRIWNKLYPNKLNEKEAYISRELAETLNLKIGDVIVISITNVNCIFLENKIINDDYKPKILRIDVPFIVGSIFDNFRNV